MEYKKIISLLDNTPNKPSNFKTKNWAEINDESDKRIAKIIKLDLKLQC